MSLDNPVRRPVTDLTLPRLSLWRYLVKFGWTHLPAVAFWLIIIWYSVLKYLPSTLELRLGVCLGLTAAILLRGWRRDCFVRRSLPKDLVALEVWRYEAGLIEDMLDRITNPGERALLFRQQIYLAHQTSKLVSRRRLAPGYVRYSPEFLEAAQLDDSRVDALQTRIHVLLSKLADALMSAVPGLACTDPATDVAILTHWDTELTRLELSLANTGYTAPPGWRQAMTAAIERAQRPFSTKA